MSSSKPGFPFRLFALAFIFSVLTTLLGSALSWHLHQGLDEMVAKRVTITKNIGRIMLLDEVLTMSARMAAATGDMRYEQRYDQSDPQLTTAISSVRATLPQTEIAPFVSETDAANSALVKMERQAFALAHQGRLQEATALLASNEYSRLKDAYAGGMRKTIEALDALIESDDRKANVLALSFVAASVLSVLFFVLTALLAVKSAKSWIGERERAEEMLRESEGRFHSLTEMSSDFYWESDAEHRLTARGSAKTNLNTATGFRGGAQIGERRWEVPYLSPDEAGWRAHRAVLDAHLPFRDFTLSRLAADGTERHVSISGDPVFDAAGNFMGYRGVGTDITERKRMVEQVRQMAFHDALTNLPNRRLLNDRLAQSMAAGKRNGRYGAMMFLDLDNFKLLNDRHGHEVGDMLLIAVAERLKSCVRETDTVARFGGDEFVVMINELGVDEPESSAQAGIVAEKIRAALAKPYVLQVRHEGAAETTVEHQCTASIGVALFGKHEASREDVLKRADTAMYRAKEAGCNLIQFYDSAP